MIKLVCQKCGRVWYTSCETAINDKCDACGGILKQEDIKESKSEEGSHK